MDTNHRISRLLLAALVAGAVMAPTAMAAADDPPFDPDLDITDDPCDPVENDCSPDTTDPDPCAEAEEDGDITDEQAGVEDCGGEGEDPDPDEEPDPEPVDPPVSGRPSFTG